MSEGVEHALHCVMILGGLPADRRLSAQTLAEFHAISASYLLKHLQALSRAGIVEGSPGPAGGYRLARPAAAISMLDVVEAIEGPEPAFRCTDVRRRGPGCIPDDNAYRRPCVIHRRMVAADRSWRAALAAESISDLVAEFETGIDPRLVAKATDWISPRLR